MQSLRVCRSALALLSSHCDLPRSPQTLSPGVRCLAQIEKTWQQALDRQGDTTKWALGDDEDAAFPPPPPMLEYINAIALDDERAANWWPPRDVVEMSPQP